jgi:hemolysin type calcium-binding protein
VTPIPRSAAALCSASMVTWLLAGLPSGATTVFRHQADVAPACIISGTPGDDVISGTPGDDVICGLEGNDRIDGGAGEDVLNGGPGDDVLNGGDGQDVATYETALEGIVADLPAGTASGEGSDLLAGVEDLTGSAGDDVLTGTAAANTLSGLGGTDLLFGEGGADALLGGDGEDYLTASTGSLLDGGEDTDTCEPGPGSVAMVSCFSPSPPDENDTHGFLDVKEVDSFLGTDEPVWRVVTLARWSNFKMWDQGFVLVYLDTFGADEPDYYALIRSVRSRLRATLYRNGHQLSSLSVWRRSRRSVSMRIPLEKLVVGTTRPFYRWRVVTLTDRCRRTCFDRIPDEGALVQPLL